MVGEKLKRHDVIIWTGIKPINNPCANSTLKVLKMPLGTSVPWVVIANELHLIHFQHHAGKWGHGDIAHLSFWGRAATRCELQKRHRLCNLSTRVSQVVVHRFSLIFNEIKTLVFYAFAHLFNTYSTECLLCASPASWLRMQALPSVAWISSPAPHVLAVWVWASFLILLCLVFLSYEMRIGSP